MIRAAALLALLPAMAGAVTLELPENAERTANEREPYASYHMPVGPFDEDQTLTIWTEGEVTRQAWRVPKPNSSILDHLAPLRQQLEEAGFEVIFECTADICGGYDFRFATEILPAPAMYVDLGEYHFLASQREGEEKPEYVSLLVSTTKAAGFVQIIRVGPPDTTPQELSTSTKTLATEDEADGTRTPFDFDRTPLAVALIEDGHFVLDDLAFATGSSALEEGAFPSLAALAAFLKEDAERKVVLVGHTDAVGGLDSNIALSKKRAASVVARLINNHGVDRAQISADGVGFLSPRASNLDDTGRQKNRRVEVILTTTR